MAASRGAGLERGAAGRQGMVGELRRRTEHGHDGVADVFVHIRAMAVKTLAGFLEVGVHHLDHALRLVGQFLRKDW